MDKQVFLQALREHKGLHISHQKDGADGPTERDILPFYVTESPYGVYVQGYCALRKARRSFRLDRVVSAELRSTVVDSKVYAQLARGTNLAIEPLGLVASYNEEDSSEQV